MSYQVTRIATLVGVALSTVAIAKTDIVRDKLAGVFRLKAPGASWRVLAIILALLNLKNLPFAWHVRIFRGLIYQIWFQPTDYPPNALFKYSIIRSHAPLLETDYNLHKSNSTYFSDFDIARTHHVTAFLRKGIRRVGKIPGEEDTSWKVSSAIGRKKKGTIDTLSASGVETAGTGANTPTPTTRTMTEQEFLEISRQSGNLVVALGSVACFFHREIPPYRPYEIWTRLLTWDRKWLYIVSYYVEAGTVRPNSYVLQPWKKSKKTKVKEGETLEQMKQRLRGKIYASAIATYVIKKGRLTIPPEIVLQRSGMLPERPPGAPSAAFAPDARSQTPVNGASAGASVGADTNPGRSVSDILEESLFPETGSSDDEPWSWEKADRERNRGLRFAQAFDGLNALRDEFDGGTGSALGVFSDSWGLL